MADGKFATAICCIDGRACLPVIDWLKEHCEVDFVDIITEPGVDGICARTANPGIIEHLRQKARISFDVHGSEVLAIAAHEDCAGNPVSPREHLRCLSRAVKMVESWGAKKVVALWVKENADGGWGAEEIKT